MPSWPPSLPSRPLAEGFGETPPNLVVRSQTETGPAKVRRRATAGVTAIKCAFRLTPAQLAAFRGFVDDELMGRALSFDWTHPVTGVPGVFRIVDPPTIEPIAAGVAWRVALSLEMLP